MARTTGKRSTIGKNIMIKRQYAAHIKKFLESKARTMQFNFDFTDDAYSALKSIRKYLDRTGIELSVWRVKKTVYVEKL